MGHPVEEAAMEGDVVVSKDSESSSSSSSSSTPSLYSPPMHEILTVVIQTSPIPSHPSTALLEALFRSFDHFAPAVLESRLIILADGCDAHMTAKTTTTTTKAKTPTAVVENHKHGKVSNDTATRYRQHLEELRTKVEAKEYPFRPIKGGVVELIELPYRHGSARGIRAIFLELPQSQRISTPLVMIGQHDNFFVRPAPVRQAVQAMYRQPGLGVGAKCLHFLSTSTRGYLGKIQKRYNVVMEPVHMKMSDDLANSTTGTPSEAPLLLPYPLIPLIFWYGRTHISMADYVRQQIFQTKCQELKPKDHLEELLGPTQLADILNRGPSAHADYGTYLIQTSPDDQEVLYHLSGRRARAMTEDEIRASAATAAGTPMGRMATKNPQQAVGTEVQSQSSPSGYPASFTTARSCKAIVPGLTIVGSNTNTNTSNDGEDPTNRKHATKFKFKQRCFHCGRKGHSFKFCPDQPAEKGMVPSETIDLS